MKWLSAFLSAVIVGVFVGFYFWTYSGQRSYLRERDARLVASAVASLREAVQVDVPDSRVKRDGARLRVSGLAKQGGGAYEVDLRDVLDRVALPEAFTALLVADTAASVIAQHPRVRLDGLRRLGDPPAGKDEKAAAASKAEREAFALRPTLQTLHLGEARLLGFCHPAPLPPEPPLAETEKVAPDKAGGATKAAGAGASTAARGRATATPAATPPSPSPSPSPAAPSATATGEALVLCGLVDEGRLEREAGAVSPLALACLLAVFALSLLAPPFLKVRMLARPQRLRFSDVFGMAVCQFLGLMILAGVIFGIAVYYGLAGLADGELQEIVGQAKTHLGNELTAIDAQLQHSEREARERGYLAWSNPGANAAPARPRPSPSPSPEPLRLANEGLLTRGLCPPRATADAPPAACDDWCVAEQPYPFFETLAWIAPDGRQRVKWWTGAGAPGAQGFFDVGRRAYFTDARDGLLTRARPGSNWPPACVMASLRAWSNGEVRAVYARPVTAPASTTPGAASRVKGAAPGPGPAPKIVQALTTRLLSLDAPVLPAGTGFAVIDARGDVLFHSDARLSRTHNLFEETAWHPRLRAAVTARVATTLVARYWGRAHSLHVEPLGPLPWSLVAFREHEWLRAVGVEALSEALLLSLAFTFAFLLLTLAYIAVAGRRTPFPWASPELVRLYLHLAGTFLIIGALYLGGLARCHGTEALVLAATLPLAAVAAALLVLGGRAWLRRPRPAAPGPAVSSTWQLVTTVSAGLLVAGASWFARTPRGLLLGALTAALLALALVEGFEGRPDSDRRGVSRFARRWLFWHRLASASFWLLFAVLPAVGFVKGATERALDAHAARSLTIYTQRLDARERALRAAYPDDLRDAETLRRRRRDAHWDVYDGALHRLKTAWSDVACAETPVAPPAPWAWVETALSKWKPYLAEHAVDLRHAHAPRDEQGRPRRNWSLCTLTEPTVTVSGGPPTFGQVAGAWPWLALLALAVAVTLSVRWAESALFVTQALPPARRSIDDVRGHTPAGARLAVLTPSGFERRELLAGDWHAQAPTDETKPGLVDLWDLAGGTLAAVEAALARPRALVLLVPAPSLPAWLADQAPAETRARWADVLARFEVTTAYASFTADDEKRLNTQIDAWLGESPRPRVRKAVETELRASRHVLEACLGRTGPTAAGDALDPRPFVRRVEELAAGYYSALWQTCSPDERLTLAQVADEGFVNPRRLDVLEGLLAKGLVIREPSLGLMNESFAAFVRRPSQAAPLAAVEAAPAGTAFGWTQLRLPLVTLAVATAVFIFVTERRLFESASGLSTLLAGTVIPLLGQVVKVMRGQVIAEAGGASGGQAKA